MSIRLRLTLLYSAILALTLVAFSGLLYVAQNHLTYDSIRANLMRQASVIAEGPRRSSQPYGQPPPQGAPPSAEPFSSNQSDGALPGRWTQTRSITGTVLAQTSDLSGTPLPLSQSGLTTAQSGAGWFETAQIDDQPLLIYSRPFAAQDGTTQIVQVAFPITQPEQSLRALRLILLIGCSLVLLAAFAAGWVLAGAALRPIQRITQTAQAIGAERDFSHRVQHIGPTDEVGQLATTFNAMLAELEATYHQIEGALDSQRRFVADASHELRTPLTTVRGNIELLRRDPPIKAGERAEVLADTTDEVDRLIRLVNQLLVLARADAGQTLQCEPLPLRPLLEDVCRQAKLLAPNRKIACTPIVEATVRGNHDALKQVLLILFDNALVHTSPEATVEMTAAVADGQAAIRVRDTGAGIPPDVLPHVFERFYRGQVSRSGIGAGLGLSIAKELVEAQAGAITVESQLGQGSVFTVSLPVG
ncbi:MAG: HAMP domain-containing sensor histidine kinase [Chloroflexi bacterium]|nr:HAMP domain-containing sensor histidine kinase [Chloroflexota bacterium]